VATVVSIMDRPGWDNRTDNIVVVEPERRVVTWVPRDLWSPLVQHRINAAFKRGGHATLRAALAEHGIPVEHGLCLTRAAVEVALSEVTVSVPVEKRLAFWYPLEPLVPIQCGRKRIEFEPPTEVLTGERLHQWMGARYAAAPDVDGMDFGRIRRQQVLLRRLLEDGFDFASTLADSSRFSITGAGALDELRQVRTDWRFDVLTGLVPEVIDELAVLVPRGTSEDEA
jgi:anionic cell wall polymer biosynthesis LytR-Cps2A-Psr (LCP) family protein